MSTWVDIDGSSFTYDEGDINPPTREQNLKLMLEHLMICMVPFAELAYSEPDNAEENWSLSASYFRAAGRAVTSASKLLGAIQDEDFSPSPPPKPI